MTLGCPHRRVAAALLAHRRPMSHGGVTVKLIACLTCSSRRRWGSAVALAAGSPLCRWPFSTWWTCLKVGLRERERESFLVPLLSSASLFLSRVCLCLIKGSDSSDNVWEQRFPSGFLFLEEFLTSSSTLPQKKQLVLSLNCLVPSRALPLIHSCDKEDTPGHFYVLK